MLVQPVPRAFPKCNRKIPTNYLHRTIHWKRENSATTRLVPVLIGSVTVWVMGFFVNQTLIAFTAVIIGPDREEKASKKS